HRLGDEVVVVGGRGVLERAVDQRVQPGVRLLQQLGAGDGAIGDAAVNLFGEQHRRLGGPGRVEATGAAQGVGQHRPVAQFCDQLGVLEEVAGGSVAHGDDSSVAGGDVLAGPGADPVAGDDEVGGAGGAVGQLHLGAARGAGPAQVG